MELGANCIDQLLFQSCLNVFAPRFDRENANPNVPLGSVARP